MQDACRMRCACSKFHVESQYLVCGQPCQLTACVVDSVLPVPTCCSDELTDSRCCTVSSSHGPSPSNILLVCTVPAQTRKCDQSTRTALTAHTRVCGSDA